MTERTCASCKHQASTDNTCIRRGCYGALGSFVGFESVEPQPELLHSFSHALLLLKMGKRVARQGWNGKGMSVCRIPAQAPNRLPYYEMTTVTGALVPWLASHTDIDAEDWVRLD